MATPSKRHARFGATTFDQTLPSATLHTITGVTNFQLKRNGELLKHIGDSDPGPSVVAVKQQDPTATLQHRDLSKQWALAIGARGALDVIHHDAVNGATAASGGYTLTLDPAIIADINGGGASHDLGEGTIEFATEFSDGATNPVTYTAL